MVKPFVGITLGLLMLTASTLADGNAEKKPLRPTAEFAVPPSGPPRFEYVSTKKCRMCHGLQYESWRELAKGHSWEALKPGVSPAVKAKAELDVNKDYTTNLQCLSCHSVGYGKPGGYAIPDPDDGRSVRLAAAREGVGCEACHGPGSGFVQIMEEVYRTGRTYKPEELRAAGRRPVGAEVCMTCHNETARCMTSPDGGDAARKASAMLKVQPADRNGYHARFPLVHRVTTDQEPPPTNSDEPSRGD